MANFKVVAIALALVLGAGCKKNKAADPGPATGSTMTGTGAGTDTMGGTGAGTDTMAGTGAGTGAGTAATPEPPKQDIVVMAAADMKWVPLDTSAPDTSPMSVPLWGDMQKEANGWLIKLKAGFAGTHHTHTGDYHGVVLSGGPSHLLDGQKKATTHTPGTYWTIPGGVAHTSQCLGKDDCVMLVHFNDGKADFAPAEMKKDGKPSDKFVEKLPKDIKWTALMPDMKDKSPMIADVWGDSASGTHGRMWKFPAGFTTPPHKHSADYHGVVIKGTIVNHAPDDKASKEIGPGSYWMQPGGGTHITACKAGSECILYTYALGKFDFEVTEGGGGGTGTGGGDHDHKGTGSGTGNK